MTKLFISVEFVLSFELIRMLKLYIHIASFCKKILPLQKKYSKLWELHSM